MKKSISIGFLIVGAFVIISFSSKTPTIYHFPELNFFPEMPLTTKYEVTSEGVELGRLLFYDPILSRDSSISCASCHRLEAAFSDSPIRFSQGINGQVQKRNTPPLFNLAWYDAFFWDGKASSLEEQVLFPVQAHDEMNLDWKTAVSRISETNNYRQKFQEVFNTTIIDSVLISYAIAQFERTLISNNSKFDQVLRREAFLTTDEYDGYSLMNNQTKGNCLHCHTTDANALGTTGKFSNNGLDSIYDAKKYTDFGLGAISGKKSDNGRFKIPSLRNIALTAPYMHDGRFETLDEVLDFYSDHFNNSANLDSKMMFNNKVNRKLSSTEKQKIISFLHTLTDSTFINNKAFSNPFTTPK